MKLVTQAIASWIYARGGPARRGRGRAEMTGVLRAALVGGLAGVLVLPSGSAARDGVAPQAEVEAAKVRFEGDVMVPMRDGIRLATNLFLPSDGSPTPVILMRSPYGKPGEDWDEARRLVEAGYAVVVQDCRGRGRSEGEWEPFRHDAEDGFDTQEWVGTQPWCNGRIGTSGGSYVGWTQWATAPSASRFLVAMAPTVPFGDAYHDILYPGGAFQIALAFGWGSMMGGIQIPPGDLDQAWRRLPLVQWDDQFGKDVPYLEEWIRHPRHDAYWRDRGISGRLADVRVPSLNVGGWYDIFSKATVELAAGVRGESGDRAVRRNQFVIMGPWAHGVGVRKVGELDFGEAAQLDLRTIERQWFDFWLQGGETGVEDWPALRLFVMGENRWRDEHEWPLARTEFTSWHLRSSGNANSAAGDGVLSMEPPPADEPPDTYTYDPNDPVPTVGGNNLIGPAAGPHDQRRVAERDDVLVFTSAPLEHPVEVTGPVRMVLFASSSARDTDFTAKLVDVHPDGRAINLCDGIIRARFRQGAETEVLLEPDSVERYEIDLWVTSNVFQDGHRIRVEVASSNFPRFDRNPNTGAPFGENADMQPATQTVFHDAARPSHLILPVIPR